MPTALFIGRFQPFHKGHHSVIKKLLDKHYKVIIGIGSSQESRTNKNPYTFEERRKMLTSCTDVPAENIFPIPDTPTDEEWVGHVKSIVPKFDEVHSGNELVTKLFKEKGYMVYPVDIIHEITATEVRKLMREGKDFKKYLPEHCYNQVKALADKISSS